MKTETKQEMQKTSGHKMHALSGINNLNGMATPVHQRQHKDWVLFNTSPEQQNSVDIQLNANRGRDLYKFNPFTRSIIRSIAANGVYRGIRPLFLDEDTKVKNKKLQKLWKKWVRWADFHGDINLYTMQGKLLAAVMHTGDIFAIPRPGHKRSPIDLSIQLIESDLVPIGLNKILDNGHEIKQGIEYDNSGRKTAVWVYDRHPNGNVVHELKINRIAIENIIHVFDPDRANQARSQPNIVSAISRTRSMQKIDDATLLHTEQQNAITGFITEKTPTGQGLNKDFFASEDRLPEDIINQPLATTAPIDTSNGTMKIGTFKQLNADQDVKFADLADAGDNYGEFTRVNQQAVAVGGDSTYSKTTGDLSKTSFSSMREGGTEFNRKLAHFYQDPLVHQFCERVADWFIDFAVLNGTVTALEALNLDRQWVLPAIPQSNPLQDVEAGNRAVRSGFTTRGREAMSRYGTDASDIDEENIRENERMDENGLRYDSDARHTTRSGNKSDQILKMSEELE